MENHPIPQDITGFQFKLIGSMTVKQFLYLAVGVIVSWFVFSSHLFFLIKWPLIVLFGGGGAALAFMPIGGRPMDTMIMNFIKAFFRDTTYIYGKTRENAEPKKEVAHVQPITVAHPSPFAQPAPQPQHALVQPHVAPPSQPSEAPAPPPVVQTQIKPEPIKDPVPQPMPQPQPVHSPAPAPIPTPIQNLPSAPLPQAPVQTISQQGPFPTSTKVRQVPASQTSSAGIPATPEVPNLVTGIIKDPRGNPLSNILVEIKDKEGNPVRAFKTNGLGHFASATPLLDGAYIMDFEDIRGENKFQRIAFEAKGQIVMPFEIISVDKREELRRELFN